MQLVHPKVAQPNRGPFGLKSAIVHWPSSTDAWQEAQKPLREAQ